MFPCNYNVFVCVSNGEFEGMLMFACLCADLCMYVCDYHVCTYAVVGVSYHDVHFPVRLRAHVQACIQSSQSIAGAGVMRSTGLAYTTAIPFASLGVLRLLECAGKVTPVTCTVTSGIWLTHHQATAVQDWP